MRYMRGVVLFGVYRCGVASTLSHLLALTGLAPLPVRWVGVLYPLPGVGSTLIFARHQAEEQNNQAVSNYAMRGGSQSVGYAEHT
jgi:hypothetical protein